MPEAARLSSSHDLIASSSSTVAVPVTVELPWNLSASAPTDSRLHNHHHYHYQQPHHPPRPDLSRPPHSASLTFYQPTSPSPNPDSFAGRAASRPPRTSSLLPPPHIAPGSHLSPFDAPRQPPPAAGHLKRPQTPPRPSRSAAAARSPNNNPAEFAQQISTNRETVAPKTAEEQKAKRFFHLETAGPPYIYAAIGG
ncbi:hypothetical protein QQZ08_012448 [Neonectria magnoliae]|uniref:Uncharacterized protein n=1 Tax=Neonectria magnoliae TaxID=2732573 RepID=A0ABR1H278_9HYPO